VADDMGRLTVPTKAAQAYLAALAGSRGGDREAKFEAMTSPERAEYEKRHARSELSSALALAKSEYASRGGSVTRCVCALERGEVRSRRSLARGRRCVMFWAGCRHPPARHPIRPHVRPDENMGRLAVPTKAAQAYLEKGAGVEERNSYNSRSETSLGLKSAKEEWEKRGGSVTKADENMGRLSVPTKAAMVTV